MRHSRPLSSERSRRTPVVLLLALMALMLQALLPAAALAAQAGAQGETMVICTQMGVQTVTLDKNGQPTSEKKGFAGLPCQDCVAATTAALPAPEPTSAPIVYAAHQVDHKPDRAERPQLARAPPRPPGQGPPLPNA